MYELTYENRLKDLNLYNLHKEEETDIKLSMCGKS